MRKEKFNGNEFNIGNFLVTWAQSAFILSKRDNYYAKILR